MVWDLIRVLSGDLSLFVGFGILCLWKKYERMVVLHLFSSR